MNYSRDREDNMCCRIARAEILWENKLQYSKEKSEFNCYSFNSYSSTFAKIMKNSTNTLSNWVVCRNQQATCRAMF